MHGNPRFRVAHIPVENRPIKTVRLSIAPDTAIHHPQTFFFRSLPNVDPYWGETNYKAFNARRIVRLLQTNGDGEGKPTPYFLLVCRGEHPRIRSPRNENGIFEGLQVPVFASAFVFKLGEPELYGSGYARYVDVEKDVGSFDWLREAVRDAANKVEMAGAAEANAGFPDMDSYADAETRRKDEKRMKKWRKMFAYAELKQSTDKSAKVTIDVPRLDKMYNAIDIWSAKITAWSIQGMLSGTAAIATNEDFWLKAKASKEVLELARLTAKATREVHDEPPLESPNVQAHEGKTRDLVRIVDQNLAATRKAFFAVKANVKPRLIGQVTLTFESESESEDQGTATNQHPSRKDIAFNVKKLEEWKRIYRLPPRTEADIDETVAKGKVALQMMDSGISGEELDKAFLEYDKCADIMKLNLHEEVVLLRTKSSEADVV